MAAGNGRYLNELGELEQLLLQEITDEGVNSSRVASICTNLAEKYNSFAMAFLREGTSATCAEC